LDQRTRGLVRARAGNACEYCRLPQLATPLIAFHIEHIVPKQHGRSDDAAGLALACDRCNGYKGPNLTSVDPDTGVVVPLFHPRKDSWDDHFMSREGCVFGVTPVGRATVRLLNMNALRRVELRQAIASTSG
jgi:5-methylcytosine-specific restriction endonuclease McrA